MPLTEKDITGNAVRAIREELGMTQTAFWTAIGVKQSVGCRYEADMPIPHPVRILIVARYVGGVKIDAGTPQGVADLTKLGAMQERISSARSTARDMSKTLKSAAQRLEAAAENLSSI